MPVSTCLAGSSLREPSASRLNWIKTAGGGRRQRRVGEGRRGGRRERERPASRMNWMKTAPRGGRKRWGGDDGVRENGERRGEKAEGEACLAGELDEDCAEGGREEVGRRRRRAGEGRKGGHRRERERPASRVKLDENWCHHGHQ
eukprot:241309-Chlamydomonas_euryale.AAC.1